MRVALTLLVVVALGYLGVTTASRVLDRQTDAATRSTPQDVAAAWAEASSSWDVDTLVALTAERADEELLTTTVAALQAQIAPSVTVEGVASTGNRATATLSWVAPIGRDGGEWAWTSELELIRGRGAWSVDWDATATHPALPPGWSIEVESSEATRAPILDHLGRTLSRTGAVVEIGVQPGRLPEPGRLLSTVGGVLPEALDELTDLLEREDLEPDWFYPLVTVSSARADEAWPDLLALSGLVRRDAEQGVGAAETAPEVVGAVGLDEDGNRIGVSGLEAEFNDALTGSAVTDVWQVDPEGRRREVLFTHQSDPAPPLVTTLDRDVQRAVDDALLAVERPAAVVVMDSATAGILAVASRPTTGYARGLEGRYPPGAIAGLVPLTAAFLDGRSVDEVVDCPPSSTVGGVRITTRGAAPGEASLSATLGGGCDTALATLGVTAGEQRVQQAVAALGLDLTITLPIAATGWSWPATDTDPGLASAGVGHARVEASTLGVASLAAAIARGAPAPPVLLADDVAEGPTPFPANLTVALRTTLRSAGEQGEVSQSGVRVAGATARAGGGAVGGDPAPATGWWFGFIEGDGPDVAFAVVVEGDDGTDATAIAQRVVRELIG